MVPCLRRNRVWTPAGVYPGENRGGSDRLRCFLNFKFISSSMYIKQYILILLIFSGLGACQKVEKPEVKGEGPLAVMVARGITSPEFHAPIERWRTTHKRAINNGDFTERECILCHDPKKSCNNCHTYIGAWEILIEEASLYWPEEKRGSPEKK